MRGEDSDQVERARVDELDPWAEIYDRWVASQPICGEHVPFYVPLYLDAEGPAVELGVGNGRLLLEAARRGRRMIGVDISPAMLRLCRERAEAEGLLDRIDLIEADFRDFELPEPAALITIPFHSIGHLVPLDEKRRALGHIFGQLAPGGRLVFDHFVFDARLARQRDGLLALRDIHLRRGGGRAYLWVSSTFCPESQSMRVVCLQDLTDAAGRVEERTVREIDFSWIDPAQSRALLGECGFEIEEVYGSFSRAPFRDDSRTQIWVARRPEES